MLASTADSGVQFGALSRDVHLRDTSLHELIDFIAEELPRWRDHPDRVDEDSENRLTSQLCGYLNKAARLSVGWDFLQFRVEEGDEVKKGRKIDLIASPCGPTVWIEGRRCSEFDTLLPIECKRLPTPTGGNRDEREYVIDRHATTGGIQRFKAGNHAAGHALAAMIGYVQAESPEEWFERVTTWIRDLDGSSHLGWTAKDLMRVDPMDSKLGVTIYRSSHTREGGLPDIAIRHLWIRMN